MAEVKNVFIKSKMNLDLDSRLVPSGEYRQGFNIQVSKSEGADVGALENVLGNEILSDLATISGGGANTQVIGQFTNVNNDTIYIFLTNNTDPTYLTIPSFNTAAGNYIYSYNVLTGNVALLVTGSFLNFSITNPIYGVNMIENLLFWTDNRNQPRKINVNLANPDQVINPTYYTTEDQISVTKYYPFQAINLYKANGDQYETTMYDVVSPKLPDNTTSNPYFQGTGAGNTLPSTYPGDPDFLEDKFVRFSYRFKYDDNEYSPFATFTQACFIPKQDGFFLGEDEKEAYRSTVVSFMENKVNEILLQIPIPTASNNLTNLYKIQEIDILYKESDSQSVEVVDTILQNSFDSITNYTINNQVFIQYTYQGTKPFKTLPEAELIRVFDKSPVKALAQEISGNRIIYGNYQDQHTPPPTLDYNVLVSRKTGFSIPTSNTPIGTTSYIEYPNSTVKQNRNYQVGVVLSDRYGRSSSVILSSSQISTSDINNDLFDVSTVFHSYRSQEDQNTIPITQWPGDSIKVLFNTAISSPKSLVSGNPGLYVGSTASSDYNPLGWYSYKIVIKQFEQEYYNVYLPGILRGYPKDITVPTGDTNDSTAFITLINDNINKVPRDLSEIGPEQKQYRSSVQLSGRVTPEYTAGAIPTYNKQFNPGIATNTVNTIGEQDFVLGNTASPPADYIDIYQTISNPYLGRITQVLNNEIGGAPAQSTTYNFFLGVYETAPVESRLNIYYETSTSGLISQLNAAISSGSSTTPNGLYNYSFSLNEGNSNSPAFSATTRFALQDPVNNGPLQSGSLTLLSIINGNNQILQNGDTGSYFNLVKRNGIGVFDAADNTTFDTWQLIIQREFYYGPTATLNDFFTFNFSSSGTNLFSTGALANVAPTISPKPSSIPLVEGVATINTGGTNFSATNGTIITADNTRDLEWSITSQPAGNLFSINSSTAVITVSGNPAGSYSIGIQVKDAGGLIDSFNTSINFGAAGVSSGFGKTNQAIIDNTMLSAGGSSLAIYWTSNATNATDDQVLDGTLGGLNTNALVLPTTLPGSADGYLNKLTTTDGPYQIEYTNSQYNALATGATQSEGGLTAGTGYIRLNITMPSDQFPISSTQSTSQFPFVMFPIVLQYRPTGADANSWVTATDIENKEIKFGGTQKNLYSYFTNNNISFNYNQALVSDGVLSNSTRAVNYNGGKVNNTETNPGATSLTSAEIFIGSINSQQNNTIQSTISKTFAFGASENYSNVPDKLGDYRLIIRYPWGLNGEGLTTDYIVPGRDQFPASDWYGTPALDYNIDWGDFYYPNDISETSFAYNVSSIGYNTQNEALAIAPNDIVYAREWMGKYVSQFYTNAALTEAWSPKNYAANTAWHSYTAFAAVGTVANEGMEFSNFIGNNLTNFQNNYQNNDRRWAAFFESTGKKRVATAIPSVTNS